MKDTNVLSGVVGLCLALETDNSYLGSSVSSTEKDINSQLTSMDSYR